jgi:4-hydroxybenzoate polyprenyltransferase/phosphoserine phosphatase
VSNREARERGGAIASPSVAAETPLFVDLDGTLIHGDVLLEASFGLLRRNLLYLLLLPIWLARGKAYLKRQIAHRVELDTANLPFNEPFLEFLRAEHARGRPLVLATATHRRYAEQVSRHLGIFAGVLATEDALNLSGEAKLQAILAYSRGRDFEYAANARRDVAIWRHARGAVLVNADHRTRAAAARVASVTAVFERPAAGWRAHARALRVHHWAKNLLLFVPFLTAHQWGNPDALQQAVLAFAAFCLCASGSYLLNDLIDAPFDRQHPRKRMRPLAAGVISPLSALVLPPILVFAALVIAAQLPRGFLWVLVGYAGLAAGYSLYLKHRALVDVLILAGLHTLRVIAGAIAIEVALSFWLLAFSVFLFFSLAVVKRCSELRAQGGVPEAALAGRDYRVSDLPVLRAMGLASGYVAVLVFALYIDSADIAARYSDPQWLWLSCPALLYWISHVWIKEGRGEMHDDPLMFALRDPASYAVLTVLLATVILAL